MANNPKNVSRADQVRARRKIEPIQRKPIPRSENRVSRDAQRFPGNFPPQHLSSWKFEYIQYPQTQTGLSFYQYARE